MIAGASPGVVAGPRGGPFAITRAFALPTIGPVATTGSLAFGALPPGDVGQLLVVQIGFRGSPTFSMPSGWTQIAQATTADTAFGGRVSGLMAWKIRAPSEPLPTFTRSGGGFAAAVMTGYTPNRGGLTFDTHSVTEQPTAVTTFTGTALTVAQPGSLLVTQSVVSGRDESQNLQFTAAGLSKTSLPWVSYTAPVPVSRTGWLQSYLSNLFIASPPFNGVTVLGADVADVPAGSTGAFSGVSIISCRTLVIAAAFGRTP